MKGYYKLRKRALKKLRTELPERLYYHNFAHTIDVLNSCNTYLRRYKISPYNSKLLRLGAIMHDIGFTVSDDNHEATGADIAQSLMQEYKFRQDDIQVVKSLIFATQIPQHPENLLEQILCDADLDYLGRNDFYDIGDELYKELKTKEIVTNRLEWNKLQIKFLEAHKYHTDFARQRRRPKKLERIEELKSWVSKHC